MTRIPVTVMRGGTSKGVFINHEEMPVNKSDWEPFLLDIMGSPDQRQIDGLGGANSLTSKIAIIKKSDLEKADVDYTFAQVSISESLSLILKETAAISLQRSALMQSNKDLYKLWNR